jgi:hypothetical protein
MTVEASALAPVPPAAPGGWLVLGKPFVSRAVDYAFVGGVFGVALGLAAYGSGFRFDAERFWLVVLLSSYAHFAASSVRLYSKPGAIARWPFVTLGLPVVTLAATSGLLLLDRTYWLRIEGFYLTWSTYHYAAQTFGLTVMYAYRSGCNLAEADRRLLRAACLLPFVYGILGPRSGLSMLVPHELYPTAPLAIVRRVLYPLLMLSPALAFLRIRRAHGRTLPLISLVTMYANAIFWTFFLDRDAFAWAAIAHALQYLVIVTVFHVKDAMSAPGNAHGRLYHVIGFYGLSIMVAYALFELWPKAYGVISINLDRPSTGRRIAWIINIHHFLVDGYIWRLRDDKNLTHVVGVPAAA